MSQPPKPRRSGPPHNPGVRELVAAKRRWSSPPKREDAMRDAQHELRTRSYIENNPTKAFLVLDPNE